MRNLVLREFENALRDSPSDNSNVEMQVCGFNKRSASMKMYKGRGEPCKYLKVAVIHYNQYCNNSLIYSDHRGLDL